MRRIGKADKENHKQKFIQLLSETFIHYFYLNFFYKDEKCLLINRQMFLTWFSFKKQLYKSSLKSIDFSFKSCLISCGSKNVERFRRNVF